jgi:hypothetical protein
MKRIIAIAVLITFLFIVAPITPAQQYVPKKKPIVWIPRDRTSFFVTFEIAYSVLKGRFLF